MKLGISIHAPHAGRDATPPSPGRSGTHFNPRAPCGARLGRLARARYALAISIHAPHAGRDVGSAKVRSHIYLFQSTRPIRGATPLVHGVSGQRQISIHAPHTGRDGWTRCSLTIWAHFNPRAPYGARLCTFSFLSRACIFQSTRPMRGATLRDKGGLQMALTFQSTRPIRGATGALSPPGRR